MLAFIMLILFTQFGIAVCGMALFTFKMVSFSSFWKHHHRPTNGYIYKVILNLDNFIIEEPPKQGYLNCYPLLSPLDR